MASLEELQRIVSECKSCQAKLALKKQYVEGDLVLKIPTHPKAIYNLMVAKLNEQKEKKKALINAQNAKSSTEDDDDF